MSGFIQAGTRPKTGLDERSKMSDTFVADAAALLAADAPPRPVLATPCGNGRLRMRPWTRSHYLIGEYSPVECQRRIAM